MIQIMYYFSAYSQLNGKSDKINFIVPTGNFGDIFAGYIAKKMGLSINKLVIATNKNNILIFLRPLIGTIANGVC